MKALKFLLYLVLGLAAIVCIFGLFAKKNYHLERSVFIKAPHEIVKEKVTHWSEFQNWSPWQHLDPQSITKIEGIDGTVGASFSWKGNDKIGSGSQKFTSISDEKVGIEVTFNEPWHSVAPASITLEKTSEGINTTWGFDMTMPFPMNAFAMFTDVERSVGKDYADGLQRLKILCEAEANHIDAAAKSATVSQIPVQNYVGIRKKVAITEIGDFFGKSIGTLMQGIAPENITGSPASLYFVWDVANNMTDMAVAVPVKNKISTLSTGVPIESYTLGGNAAVIDLIGPYGDLKYSHLGMDKYLGSIGATPSEPVVETYFNSPMTEPDSTKLHTQVIYFFKPSDPK